MTHANPVAERLRAFARLYEHMAEQSWSEDRARDLRTAEKECLRARALLLHGSAEAETAHFRGLLQYRMAGGDTVGKIAARAGVKTLVTHSSSTREKDSALQVLADEVAGDFLGRIVVGEDLMEIEV